MEATKKIEVESKDNYFIIPVEASDVMEITLNNGKVIELIIPYDGKLKCYLSRESSPIMYK